jgi:hypothetical protein
MNDNFYGSYTALFSYQQLKKQCEKDDISMQRRHISRGTEQPVFGQKQSHA